MLSGYSREQAGLNFFTSLIWFACRDLTCPALYRLQLVTDCFKICDLPDQELRV